MKILFTKVFKVEAGSGTYKSFIEGLRRELRSENGVQFSHNRPVLPPQQIPPTKWVEIVLQTETHEIPPKIKHEIRLLLRRDNLYLDAYRMQNSDTWLWFESDAAPPGSSSLGFGGGYGDLANASGRGRENINLGRDQLRDAVNHLANSGVRQERARWLTVVIQMICESIRFEYISNFLLDRYIENRGLPPDSQMLALENGWGNLSEALLRADAQYFPRFPLDTRNAMGIRTAEQAAAAIGIVLYCYGGMSTRVPRMAVSQLLPPPAGRPLVEVFAVQINNIDGENPGDLYGTITVTDGLWSQYIYNRKKEAAESIKPGESASLTGPPSLSISALGSFTIDVALMDRDSFPDTSPDDEVSKGQVAWNIYDIANVYDKPLFHNVNGKYGSATVIYSVLNNAVQATVEVTLINGDGEDPADVYGLLAASNSKFTSFESVLFQIKKESGESAKVSPEKPIPLLRSVVAVPLHSDLIVRADLYDRDPISSDDEIAKGRANFPAELSGTFEHNIKGQYGEIKVKVTWTS